MKKILPAILILLTCWTVAFGQDSDSTKFGNITQYQMLLKQAPNYKKAEAVVLDDMGKSGFLPNDEDGSISITFQRTTRIKIFSDAGIEYSQVKIPYQIGYGVDEKVSDVEAATYNYENGKLVKTELDPKDIYDEQVSKASYVVKFALPNVKKGSIIEYRYKLTTNSVFGLPNWRFQRDIPVIFSYYQVKMIPFYEYVWSLQGDKSNVVTNSYVDPGDQQSHFGVKYNEDVHYFEMTNVPAFKDEDYIPAVNDYIMKINFQLSKIKYPNGAIVNIIKDWKSLIGDCLKEDDFGKYLKRSMKLSSRLMDFKKLQEQPEKVRFDSVMDYMKKNFKWNGYENWFATQKADQFLSNHSGSAQDINLFTVGMLRSAGLDASPVLISTRKHGTIRYNYPYLHFFNDVIIVTKINGQQVLSDASSANSLNNRIPVRCINDKGLVVEKDSVKWVPLNRTPLSQTITVNNITFNHDTLRNTIDEIATEYDALFFRDNYPEKHDALRKKLESKNYTLIDSTISVENLHNRGTNFILHYSFNTQPQSFRNKIYVAPFFNEIGVTNMFTQDERTYPVDLIYPDKMEYVTTIDIPAGYKPDYLPTPVDMNNNLYQLKYDVMQSGNKLTVMLVYFFKQPLYSSLDYFRLQSFFAQVIKKGNEKIVLVKTAK